MDDAKTSMMSAAMRIERAVLNVKSVIDDGSPVDQDQFVGSMTRVVIVMNTLAEALHQGADGRKVANLLWQYGEQLGIKTDGSRN